MSTIRFCEPMNSSMQELLQSNFKMAAKIHYAFEINQKYLFWLEFDIANSGKRKHVLTSCEKHIF